MPGKKILVVEDNPSMRFLVSKYLQKSGFDVITAADGIEALRALQLNTDIGVIFLDFMMPKMNGMEFLNKVAHLKIDMGFKVCMMTAKETPLDIKECLRNGADDYIVKPVDELILINKAKILQERRDMDEFCYVTFLTEGNIILPDGKLKIEIQMLSEGAINFTSEMELPVGGRIYIESPKVQEVLGTTAPFLLRIYQSERSGIVFKNAGSFIALKDAEYKRLRSVTTKGG